MLHFVTSYMKQNNSRKQTLESAQYGLEISFKLCIKLRHSIISSYPSRQFKYMIFPRDFLLNVDLHSTLMINIFFEVGDHFLGKRHFR